MMGFYSKALSLRKEIKKWEYKQLNMADSNFSHLHGKKPIKSKPPSSKQVFPK